MRDVQTFFSDAAGSLHGTTMDRVKNPLNKLRQAAIVMLSRISPRDTIRRYQVVNALYDKVYNYTAPTDLKGTNKILDLRPIGPRNKRDQMDQTTTKQFDIRKLRNTLVVETINGVRTLRVSKALTPQVLLADLGAFDLSTGVTAFGDASNLSQNTLDFVTGYGSVQFDLSGSTGAGGIDINLPDSVDISQLLNLGSLFGWINFPDASRLTSIDLRWGSDSSNYWHKTVTAPNDRPSFVSQAWTPERYDWQSATKVGSPDSTAIAYLRVTFNYTGATSLTAVKVDSITASLGAAYELVYYSQNLFQDASSLAWKETPTALSDIIYCDPMAETILMYEFLKIICRDLKGKNMSADVQSYIYELEGDGRIVRGNLVANRSGLYRDYISQFPSEEIPVSTSYYDFASLSGIGEEEDTIDDHCD